MLVFPSLAVTEEESSVESGVLRDVEPGSLVARARVERPEVRSGEQVAIWVTFENRTDGAIDGLRFDALASRGETLRVEGKVWNIQPPPHRPWIRRASETSSLTIRLGSGDRAIHELLLRLSDTTDGPVIPHLVYRWRDGESDRLVVAEAPSILVSRTKPSWPPWLERLFLPIAVVAVPLLLNILAASWQKRKKEADQEREEWRKTYDQLLPEVRSQSGAYLSLSSRIRRFEQSYRALPTPPSTQEAELGATFADLMLIFVADRDIPSWSFLNRDAEKQAATCWELYRRRTEQVLGRQELAKMIRLIGPVRQHSKLMEIFELETARLPEPPSNEEEENRRRAKQRRRERREAEKDAKALWQVLRTKFFDWTGDDFADQIVLLQILRRLLYLEVNRILAPLYRQSQTYPTRAELPTIRELSAFRHRILPVLKRAESNAEPDLRKRIIAFREYFKDLENLKRKLENQPPGDRLQRFSEGVGKP